MSAPALFAIAAAALALFGVWRAWRALAPPAKPSAGDLKLTRLADGVYVYRGYFSNSAVFVTPGGVVVVDTQVSPRAAERMRAEIEKVTDKPVTHVINTHYHGDHSGGNAAFEGAEIVATEDTARYVVERDAERVEYANTFGLEFVEVHPTIPPTRTFAGALELDAGGEKIVVKQIGRAETPDACVVWWPSRGVVACGDGIATHDYPYLGVPFLDEGLRDDGEWLGFLRAVKALSPSVLIAGHGPPIVGVDEVRARIELLESLFTDLLAAVREELATGRAVPEIVERADAKLARYRARKDLFEHTVSQRFAIYRAINNLTPSRAGKGWWDDLRPSVVRRAPRDEAREVAGGLPSGAAVCARAASLVEAGDRPLAISVLEVWVESHPDDASALALLSDVLFDGARGIRPAVDGTEYIALATRVAKAALSRDPEAQLALLNLGASEVFGGMVLAQPMDRALAKLERAVAAGGLTRSQRAKALFFIGKAHQMEGRDPQSDAAWRALLPPAARPLYPLLRPKLRSLP